MRHDKHGITSVARQVEPARNVRALLGLEPNVEANGLALGHWIIQINTHATLALSASAGTNENSERHHIRLDVLARLSLRIGHGNAPIIPALLLSDFQGRGAAQQELREAFSTGWAIESMQEAQSEVRPDLTELHFSPGGPHAWFCVIRRR